MTKNGSQDRSGYRLIHVLFDKLEERERRIVTLEAENAALIRKLAERLFRERDND